MVENTNKKNYASYLYKNAVTVIEHITKNAKAQEYWNHHDIVIPFEIISQYSPTQFTAYLFLKNV